MPLVRIGHKGADALVPGNTVASFERAVEVGVDVIEFDALWLEDGRPEMPASERSPLVVAHDRHAAATHEPLTLDAALEAFTRPPLDQVRINLDLKQSGREDEIIESLRRHGLISRTSVSTMEIPALREVGRLAPEISRGWTVPRVTRDWLSKPTWMKPILVLGLASVRARVPAKVRRSLPDLGVDSIWAFYGVVSPRLIKVARAAGVKVYVWTVDDTERIDRLKEMGVDGICSNDPRLLNR